MSTITIDQTIQALEHIRTRPFSFMSMRSLAIVDFLNGYYLGLGQAGLRPPRSGYNSEYTNILEQNGWEVTSGGPWHEMKRRGYTNEEIIDETLKLEILYWHKVAQGE